MGQLGKTLAGVIVLIAISLVFSIPEASGSHTTTNIKFDQQPNFIVIDHSDMITAVDSQHSNVGLHIWVYSFAKGVTPIPGNEMAKISTVLNEDPLYTDVFRTFVEFNSVSTSQPLQKIKVEDGGTVLVQVKDNSAITAKTNVTTDQSQTYMNKRWSADDADCFDPNLPLGGDSDVDGICDSWEDKTLGNGLFINYPDGSDVFEALPSCNSGIPNDCPDANKKDIYLEIDYMEGHRPNQEAIDRVVAVFLEDEPAFNKESIRLHVQIDDEDADDIKHQSCTTFPGTNWGSKGFDQIKREFFGTPAERAAHNDWDGVGWQQKKQVFRYALFVHSQCGSSGSGIGEVFGNDMMITLGGFDGNIGNPDQQEGTLMHELGHNLNLNHGGNWNNNMNCKPNYLSVMSYSRQFSDLVSDRNLDFSRQELGTMANPSSVLENDLDEADGIERYDYDAGERTVYGPNIPFILTFTGYAIDWDGNPPADDRGVARNINEISSAGCTNTPTTENMLGYHDWENINLDSKGSGNWNDGRPLGSSPAVVQWLDHIPTHARRVIPSSICPPVEQILSVVPPGVAQQAIEDHFRAYRTCAGGVGINNPAEVQDIIYRDAIDGSPHLNSTFGLTINIPSSALLSTSPGSAVMLPPLPTPDPSLVVMKSDELTSDNVVDMRIARVNSIIDYMQTIPDGGFIGSKNTIIQDYNAKLNVVRSYINDWNMINATGDLEKIMFTYQNKFNEPYATKLTQGTIDIMTSYGKAQIPEFETIAMFVLITAVIPILVLSRTKLSLVRNL